MPVRPMDVLLLIAWGISNLLACWAIIRAFRNWALRKRLLDQPNARSSHARPTPRGGGIGIVIVVFISWAILLFGQGRFWAIPLLSAGRIGLIAGGAILVVGISWLDDLRRGLSPGLRLVVHMLAAALAVIAVSGWDWISIPFVGPVELGVTGLVIALVWVIGLMNAYNFMDGIDGLAGVQAVTASAGWIVLGLVLGDGIMIASGILLASATAGFLIHNWPPAKIFMGDIGSVFLGYCFAALPLVAARIHDAPVAGRLPVAGLLMVAPFVLDASYTFLRRLARREKLSQAHRSHLYQRLVLTGLSHRAVTLLYMFLGLGGSAAAISYVLMEDRSMAGLLAFVAMAAVWGVPFAWTMRREGRVRMNREGGPILL